MSRLKLAARKILSASVSRKIPYSTRELSILFTGDSQIKRLNGFYRGKNRPTDVLSFSQLEGSDRSSPSPESLGDIVISLETARKQAREAKIPLNEEILRLLIHGILHLLGYEHENVSSRVASRMFRQEDLLLECLRKEFCR